MKRIWVQIGSERERGAVDGGLLDEHEGGGRERVSPGEDGVLEAPKVPVLAQRGRKGSEEKACDQVDEDKETKRARNASNTLGMSQMGAVAHPSGALHGLC